MLRKIVVLLIVVCMCYGNACAENNYPYKGVCPVGPSGTIGGKVVDADYWNPSRVINGVWVDLNYWVDRWSFAQCECTSYSAYKMDDELYTLTDIHFNNSYLGQHWGDGNHWDDAARAAGIKVDNIPIPGDIAYWNTDGDGHGHVEFVYKVSYDDNMNATKVCYQGYNGNGDHDYTDRCVTVGTSGWINNPSGYIHILAHQECATSYYFNRMDAHGAFPEQTQEEWEKIFLLVWDKYREGSGSCDSGSQVAFQNLWDAYGGLPSGFGGGGSGPGYDDDTGGDTWSGYAHHVGLKYMKIGKKSSGHWSGSKTWTVGEIPSKRDFRVKLKQKGGEWPDGDTCAEVWFSHNKYFTDEDLYLKKKCKDLSDEDEDERSIYIKDVHLPNMETGKNYYFFTRVTYPGGINPSSDNDHDEYVKIEIVENPDIPEGSGNNNTGSSTLSPAEIINIIF